jgi:hypothetical protein
MTKDSSNLSLVYCIAIRAIENAIKPMSSKVDPVTIFALLIRLFLLEAIFRWLGM